MLIPRRVKHRKQHRPHRTGNATGGTHVSFGEFGIQALEHSYVTNRQIEAARIAMTRHIRRGGKVWINIYPDRPLTKKPAETRMGSGKGSPEWWIANVKPGHVRAVRSRGASGQGGPAPRDPQAPDEVQSGQARAE
jgi:large subunit ribosomal protein L16